LISAPTCGSFARPTFSIGRSRDRVREPFQLPSDGQETEEAFEFNCMLAAAAFKGNAQEVQWLINHTPTDYSPHLQQGAIAALFASILGGQHAVCQLLLEWYNPNKEPMELPICNFNWDPDTTGRHEKADVSFLGLAYEWRTIPGNKQESAGHYRRYNYDKNTFPSSAQYLGLLRLLLEYNASPTLGAQGLFQAIALSADVAAIQQLLQHGLDANAALSDGNTFLHLLVAGPDAKPEFVKEKVLQERSRQIEVAVRTLLQAGASPMVRNDQQKTPLDECFSRLFSIKALIDALQPRGHVVQPHASSGAAICSICMDCPAVMVLVPCGHLGICQQCSRHAQQRCPICRTVDAQMVRTYEGYVQVWLSQPSNANLFGVRLIGDAKAPHLSSSMAPADLALYSEWGMSRMQQHMDTKPLELVLLVLTDPAILKEAILGLHSGVMSLSWHTAEASCYGRFHWSECPYCQPQQASIAKYIFNMLSACSSAFWRLLVRIISVTKAQDCLFLCCQLPSELIILA